MQKIRTALLSYGMSGKVFHAPFLSIHPAFELVGAWERTHKKIQQDHPETQSYDSLEALLFDDLDLVVVNTPTATHFDYARKALLAGKHVLVEKAFTATLEEAEKLKALSEEKNVKLAVFQNRRWDSDFKLVKQVLAEGHLGDLVEAEFRFDRYNPILSPKTHKESVNAGSGLLKDLGPHIADQAISVFGMPEGLYADIRKTRDHSVVDDYFDVLLYYPTLRVRLKGSFFNLEPVASYILQGKKGSFLKPRADVQEDDLKAGSKPGPDNWGFEPEGKEGLLHYEADGIVTRKKRAAPPGNYYDFFEALAQAINGDGEIPVSAADGINVMKIIEAAIQSDARKQYIKI